MGEWERKILTAINKRKHDDYGNKGDGGHRLKLKMYDWSYIRIRKEDFAWSEIEIDITQKCKFIKIENLKYVIDKNQNWKPKT